MLFRLIILLLICSCAHEPQAWMSDSKFTQYAQLDNMDKYLGNAQIEFEDEDEFQEPFDESEEQFSNYFESEEPQRFTPANSEAPPKSKKLIIRSVLQQNRKQMKQCFPKNLQENGRIQVVFTVKPNGKVQRVGVGVEDNDLSLKTRACLVETIYKFRFPTLDTNRNIKVNQPILF